LGVGVVVWWFFGVEPFLRNRFLTVDTESQPLLDNTCLLFSPAHFCLQKTPGADGLPPPLSFNSPPFPRVELLNDDHGTPPFPLGFLKLGTSTPGLGPEFLRSTNLIPPPKNSLSTSPKVVLGFSLLVSRPVRRPSQSQIISYPGVFTSINSPRMFPLMSEAQTVPARSSISFINACCSLCSFPD